MQPAAAPVAATPVATGGDELPSMVLAAFQDSAADMIPSTLLVTSVPLLNADGVRIDVTYTQFAIASASSIAITVQ